MSFQVSWTSTALRDLSRLPPRVVEAILKYAEERLALNPMRLSKPLHGEYAGLRSARNGDYRVLIRVDEERRIVVIRSVDHRAHAYRRR